MQKLLLKLRIAFLKHRIKSNIYIMKCYANDVQRMNTEINLLIAKRIKTEVELKRAEQELISL